MDAFTMVILACVAGEPKCTSARVADVGFTSIEACEARIDAITDTMTSEFGRKPEFKGRAVTYDVSCMSRKELLQTLGIADLDA
ncbi:MAG TPA: hypothetical protein VGN82_17435 [Bosea sp. (in: a-proteobacteria)]|jgi:hypothetical protein|uniref:hypothetical protein n=1 Tax=Bosea sp. (in: a-proteobacteria) TaxID=1871050 RepID=UPI002E12024C|nr:hypothetical protein [Bosea sp. (in: a-proteobacteria)]